jgi:Questin oxidase-like
MHLQTLTPDTPTDLLHRLLDSNLQLPPEYRDQLTNHLPMALHALQSLGASPERLRSFHATYSRRFNGLNPPAFPAATDARLVDWRALRGQADAYAKLLACFNALIKQDGMDATLRQALPKLLPGVAAAAFHGIIRTAHAVQARHSGELAAALAYWAWRWQPLPVPSMTRPLLAFEIWAARLVQQASGWRSDTGLISTRMAQASFTEIYSGLAGALAPALSLDTRIAELAGLAVARYVAAPNLTVLHMITGLRALRLLLPWLEHTESKDGLQAVIAHNFTAAYLAAGVLPLDKPPEVPALSWAEVATAAIASDDEHVIKLVHACQDEAAVYEADECGEGQYLRAAALVVTAR